jgi:hypothetical protein
MLMKKTSFLVTVLVAFLNLPANAQENRMRIKITINDSKVTTATLEDNSTAAAFREMLPLTLDMSDFHSNEKFFDLPNRLPVKDANPGKIQTGDLMIWSSSTLVLFYKSFPTSYSYTKVGRIDDTSGLAAAVGFGNVKVTFELE